MTNDEIIALIEKAEGNYEKSQAERPNKYYETFTFDDQSIAKFAQLLLAKERQWISVKDMPIPDNTYIIVWVTTISMPDIALYIADKQIFESTTSDWYLEEVNHWMPLPAAPKQYSANTGQLNTDKIKKG